MCTNYWNVFRWSKIVIKQTSKTRQECSYINGCRSSAVVPLAEKKSVEVTQNKISAWSRVGKVVVEVGETMEKGKLSDPVEYVDALFSATKQQTVHFCKKYFWDLIEINLRLLNKLTWLQVICLLFLLKRYTVIEY